MRLLASSNLVIAGAIVFGFGCVGETFDSRFAMRMGMIVLSIGGLAFIFDYIMSFKSEKGE